jgi:hypothetical protein
VLQTPFYKFYKPNNAKSVASVSLVKSATVLKPETFVRKTAESTVMNYSIKVAQNVSSTVVDLDRKDENKQKTVGIGGDFENGLVGVGAIYLPTICELSPTESRLFYADRRCVMCSQSVEILEQRIKEAENPETIEKLSALRQSVLESLVIWREEFFRYSDLVKEEHNFQKGLPPYPILQDPQFRVTTFPEKVNGRARCDQGGSYLTAVYIYIYIRICICIYIIYLFINNQICLF